jgi:hypothetical protein
MPGQQKEANEFLRTHKPAGDLQFNADRLFVFYDDGTNPAEYQIADLEGLLQGSRNTKIQHQIALQVLEYELSDLNMVHNKTAFENKTHDIRMLKKLMDAQDVKAQFVEARIAALRSGKADE